MLWDLGFGILLITTSQRAYCGRRSSYFVSMTPCVTVRSIHTVAITNRYAIIQMHYSCYYTDRMEVSKKAAAAANQRSAGKHYTTI